VRQLAPGTRRAELRTAHPTRRTVSNAAELLRTSSGIQRLTVLYDNTARQSLVAATTEKQRTRKNLSDLLRARNLRTRGVEDFDESGIVQLLQESNKIVVAPDAIDIVLHGDHVDELGNRHRLPDR
jgi:hypothetical protein